MSTEGFDSLTPPGIWSTGSGTSEQEPKEMDMNVFVVVVK